MGINHDEFSDGVEPIKPINAKATTAEGGGGNGAAGNGTAGAPLEPNRADINAHLYALFHPDFVMPYPDAWIEIAIANPGRQRQYRAEGRQALLGVRAAGGGRLRGAEEQERPQRLCRRGVAAGRDRPLGPGDQEERHHGRARVGGFRQGG